MSVKFSCDDPSALLSAFKLHISQSEPKGKITTWQMHSDGKHFTHRAADWSRKAWFRPIVSAGHLTFSLIRPKGNEISTTVYAYYHGHLIETFLAHFDLMFDEAVASALAADEDLVSQP
ncbi:hypothetical protein [Pandoraea norimbergensis]|uniref:Uncharacterized protein n=1 Tax=Pandoraea norimbergensis TaxID=93219 RepID=A0ABN4JJH9_9BURK|nr:hypothetical protein [Pandoraea norimbergensis]ALS60160.1 hypothetical protein AT302_10670 [Pandoraea norimbergensis]